MTDAPPATSTRRSVPSCPFDHHDPAFVGPEKYRRYAELRDGRVRRSSLYGGFWILAHAADIEEALLDPDTYSSQRFGVTLPRPAGAPPLIGIEQDGDLHMAYRRIYNLAVGTPVVTHSGRGFAR